MKNSADLGMCYPPRPSASVDNTLLNLQNSSYPTQPHSIIANYWAPVVWLDPQPLAWLTIIYVTAPDQMNEISVKHSIYIALYKIAGLLEESYESMADSSLSFKLVIARWTRSSEGA